MAPPSPLAIATSSVTRLLKEEASYRTELEGQQKRLHALETQTGDDEDGNRGFQIVQEKKAIRETEAVFGHLRESIGTAVEALEELLASEGRGDGVTGEEVKKGREAVAKAKVGATS